MPPTADFHYFFIRFPWTALTFSKKTRHTENVGRPQVLFVFLHFRVCARASKINGKSHRMRFSSDSRHRELSNNEFFSFRNAEMVSEVSPGRLGRPAVAPLGPSWQPTEPSWRALGPSLGASGPLLDALGSLLATLLVENPRNSACRIGFPWISAASGDENLRN